MGCNAQFTNKNISEKLLQIKYKDIKLSNLSGDLHGWCYDINNDKAYKPSKTENPVNKPNKEINSRDFLIRNSLQPSKSYFFHHYHDPRRYIEQYRRENAVHTTKYISSQSRNKAFQKMQKEQECRMIAFKNKYTSPCVHPVPQQKEVHYWWRVGMHQPVLGPSPLVTSSMLASYEDPNVSPSQIKRPHVKPNPAITHMRIASAGSIREENNDLHFNQGHLTDRTGMNDKYSLSKIEGPAKELLMNGIQTITARRKYINGKLQKTQSISAKLSTTVTSQTKDTILFDPKHFIQCVREPRHVKYKLS